MTLEQKLQEDEKWIHMMELVDRGHLTNVIEIRKNELQEAKGMTA